MGRLLSFGDSAAWAPLSVRALFGSRVDQQMLAAMPIATRNCVSLSRSAGKPAENIKDSVQAWKALLRAVRTSLRAEVRSLRTRPWPCQFQLTLSHTVLSEMCQVGLTRFQTDAQAPPSVPYSDAQSLDHSARRKLVGACAVSYLRKAAVYTSRPPAVAITQYTRGSDVEDGPATVASDTQQIRGALSEARSRIG